MIMETSMFCFKILLIFALTGLKWKNRKRSLCLSLVNKEEKKQQEGGKLSWCRMMVTPCGKYWNTWRNANQFIWWIMLLWERLSLNQMLNGVPIMWLRIGVVLFQRQIYKYWNITHKFGTQITKPTKDTKAIYRENWNNIWWGKVLK